MTDIHKERITKCYETLVTNMTVTRVVDHLRTKLLLDMSDADEILHSGVREQQVRTILDILLRKPDSAFDQLVGALRSTGQPHLANPLGREVIHVM